MTLAEFFKAQEPLSAERIDLDAVRKSRAAFAEALEPMERLRAELLASIPEIDPDLPPTTAEQEKRQRRMADVQTLTDGKWQRGISDPRLQPFVGSAGSSGALGSSVQGTAVSRVTSVFGLITAPPQRQPRRRRRPATPARLPAR